MKHLKLALLISAITVFAVACNNSSTTISQTGNTNNAATPVTAKPAATPNEFAAARTTYNAACIRCHKDNGEGGTVALDEGETLKVPTFKEGHALKHDDAGYAKQIAKGGDGMPAFETRLSPEQINGLVNFIRHEFQADLKKGGTAGSAP
jgi:mono/diheme cytochrome c family protein